MNKDVPQEKRFEEEKECKKNLWKQYLAGSFSLRKKKNESYTKFLYNKRNLFICQAGLL